jgi:hypothetical protein
MTSLYMAKVTGSNPENCPLVKAPIYTSCSHGNDHMNCGQCEDACTVDKPPSTFFQQSGRDFGEVFARFDELTSID